MENDKPTLTAGIFKRDRPPVQHWSQKTARREMLGEDALKNYERVAAASTLTLQKRME